MDGNQGIDQMSGTSGSDFICGGPGNDKISGGPATDLISGDTNVMTDKCPSSGPPGSDIINGCDGNDQIAHSNPGSIKADAVKPDGHKDIIDCGPGNDEALINISVDHDIATNCETVTAG